MCGNADLIWDMYFWSDSNVFFRRGICEEYVHLHFSSRNLNMYIFNKEETHARTGACGNQQGRRQNRHKSSPPGHFPAV